MRTLIVGAGAIGSFLAAKLTDAGADVTLHGLGSGFEHIANHGLQVAKRDDSPTRTVRIRCSLTPPPSDGWDLLVFAVKAQDLPAAAQQFSKHAQDATILLPQNGLPYWQFLGAPGSDIRLKSVDPECATERALPLHQIVGCVVTKGLAVLPDGTLVETVVPSDSFALGDVVVGSNVSTHVVSLLENAGLPARQVTDIRLEKWRKLLVNVAFNPLGAISHLGFGEVLDVDSGERLARTLISESLEIARHYGITDAIDPEAAIARARSSRFHKTSMLQDTEAGRRLEVEPILGVLLELGRNASLPSPWLHAIYDCMRLIDYALAKGPIRQTIGRT
jgi:2-dehydropantoate 2-reductase